MKKIIAILMIFVLTINILSISSFADNEVEDNMIDSQTNAEMQNMRIIMFHTIDINLR